ncbi:MAG: hypothetical protein WC358_07240 [Ignavibacteria bacterium]|jgi:sensor histidine kinase YesM
MIQVSPLIFMPFIENAFKYGSILMEKPGIKINLDIKDTDLCFEVTNCVKKIKNSNTLNVGFGTNMIKHRLDLLFENNYNLKIINENDNYTVKLNIKTHI